MHSMETENGTKGKMCREDQYNIRSVCINDVEVQELSESRMSTVLTATFNTLETLTSAIE